MAGLVRHAWFALLIVSLPERELPGSRNVVIDSGHGNLGIECSSLYTSSGPVAGGLKMISQKQI
jgi:hypothetical protein